MSERISKSAKAVLWIEGAIASSAMAGTASVFAASAEGNADELCAALAQGDDANAADADSTTALGMASLRGHTDCVRLLLSARAAVDQADSDGITPLMHACDVGYADCVVRRRPLPAPRTQSPAHPIRLSDRRASDPAQPLPLPPNLRWLRTWCSRG